ncbi:hypothetical protein BDW59DRAFT_143368 [Aspergillus cavernicola]|uniref:DUF1640-domain-containing protein n=1 Tax=Aspergillus cavernicola TaxID=176166 RepID=A0ABR4IKB7_9EURO
MASPRLPFLYPNLMRAVKSCEPSTYRSIRVPSSRSNARPPRTSRARFHTTPRCAQGSIQRRYGPAVAPNIPPPGRPNDESPSDQSEDQSAEKESGDATGSSPSEQVQAETQAETQAEMQEQSPSQPQSRETQENSPTLSQPEVEKTAQSTEHRESEEDELESQEEEVSAPEILEAKQHPSNTDEHLSEEQDVSPILDGNPLEGVLHMPPPSSYLTPSTTGPHNQPTHMAAPPYVHHFDTYTLVQDLANGGFSDKQSVTIMKAVRKILQNNLDFAKHNLTSKSDVENETYLFQAACSELQSSLQTARNSEIQQQRASRTSLQHEADILSQRTNQELSGLKDDIKGMFNDHKMTVRELQRSIDTSVQELNYKITVSLNSDSKSEIEGLRWILTRRAALAIAISAFMILVFLRYSSSQKAQNGTEKKKEAPPKESTEPRTTSEFAPHAQGQVPEAHLSESLG